MVLDGSMLSMFVFFAAATRRARRLSENAEDLHWIRALGKAGHIDATGLIKSKAGVYVGS